MATRSLEGRLPREMTSAELLQRWETLRRQFVHEINLQQQRPRDFSDLRNKFQQMQGIFEQAQEMLTQAQMTKKSCLDLKNRLLALSFGDSLFLLIGVGGVLLPEILDKLGTWGKVLSVAFVILSQSCSKTNDYLASRNSKQEKELRDLLQITGKAEFLRIAQKTVGLQPSGTRAVQGDLQEEWQFGREAFLDLVVDNPIPTDAVDRYSPSDQDPLLQSVDLT